MSVHNRSFILPPPPHPHAHPGVNVLTLLFFYPGIICRVVYGNSSVARAPDSWLKGLGFESLLERRDNFLLQGQLSVLTLILVSVPRRVTAVARKRSRSFCQKCRWQVTAKHAYTLRKWLCMKWHSAWWYGVHRTCAETAAVSCSISHGSALSTPLRLKFKNALKS